MAKRQFNHANALLTIGGLVLAAWRLARSVPASPCDNVTGKPPRTDPLPLIKGRVTDASDGTAVNGATMKLYRCVDGGGTFVENATTDTNGDYEFEDLAPENWYFVQAEMTGPLSAMSPASGTENPSDAVGLGDSVTDLDFAFE